jgi:hypothetical protein
MSTRGRRVAGVDVTEIDLTQLIESRPTGVPAGVLGTAERGPAFVPVWFSELRDWTIRYGAVDGRFGPLAVSEWLQNAESALYIRLLGVGNGERRLPDGNVKEAGFIVGTDRVFDQDPDNQTYNAFAYTPAPPAEPFAQVPGRVYFLGALHEDRRSFDVNGVPSQDDLLLRAGIDTTLTPSPVVRAVLVTPKGVVATLLSNSNFNPEPLEDVAPDASDAASYGSGAGLLGGSTLGYLVRARNNAVTSRLFLNGHVQTPEWSNDIEFSFDPRSAVYLAKVLNTNPEKLEEAGHCLYAWWEVDSSRVVVTGERVFTPEPFGDDTATLGAFCIPGKEYLGTEFEDNAVNYENFEERYSEPLTPWVLSEELPGGERKRLFRVHVFDSGEGANTAYKVGISNIVRRENDWTRFDLTLRAWDDSDTKPVIIESFPSVNLNPDDPNYIVRRVGDTRLKYIWDANPENQGLLTEGLYPPVSRRIWIEVPAEVEDGLGVKDLLPVAHEGLPHITVDGWDGTEGLLFWDAALLGGADTYEPTSLLDGNFARFTGVLPNTVSFDLTDATLFDVGADALILTLDLDGVRRFTYVYTGPITAADVASDTDFQDALDAAFGVGTVSVSDVGDELILELNLNAFGSAEVYTANVVTGGFADEFFAGIRQAPVPMRENLRVSPRSSKPNARHNWGFRFNIPNVSFDGSLANWSKFFPDFGTRPFWAKNAGVDPDADYGSVLDVNAYNNNLFTLERIVARHLAGQPNVLDPNPVAWGSARYVRDADPSVPVVNERYVRAEDFSNPRNRPYLKFTFPVFGGFDGLNIFDRQRARLTDLAVAAEREFGLPALSVPPVNPDDPINPIFGPTYTAWLKAAEILASEDDVDVQVLVTPGLRHRSVVDRICELTESRLDAVYLLDPEIIPDTEVDAEYTDDITIANLTNTIDRWLNREIDNTFVGAYFPDVVLPDPTTGRIKTVPASVAVLGTLAFNDAVSFPWFPAAGANRGVLTRVETIPVVFEEEAQARLYDVSINPLVDKGTLGPVVWGNKTTRQTESVLNRLSVRRLLIEIRRRVRSVAKDFLFEPNIEATLAEFQARVNPILTDIKQKRGIQKALVYIDTTVTTQLDIENGVIRGVIGIQPNQAAEFAEIDFELRNTGDV